MPKLKRPQRLHTQPKRFTPSSPIAPIPQSYLLFFRDTNERLIVQKSSIKRINNGFATVKIGSKQRTAEIEAQGSFQICQDILDEKERQNDKLENMDSDERDTDDDDVSDSSEDVAAETFDDHSTNAPTTNHRTVAGNSLLSAHTSSQLESRSASPNSSVASRIGISPRQKGRTNHNRSPSIENNETQSSRRFEDRSSSDTAPDASLMRIHMDKQFSSLMKTTERHLQHLNRKIDRLTNSNMFDHSLDVFREKGEEFAKELIYGGENLLKLRAKDYGSYARLLMRKLFSTEELVNSILPPGAAHYSRPPLDSIRFEYLHQAVSAKYRLASIHYDEFYAKLLRPKLTDFLIDERKRNVKKVQTASQSDPASRNSFDSQQ